MIQGRGRPGPPSGADANELHRPPLELLEALDPDLLRRLLQPFEGDLAARGVPLDASVSADAAWHRRLRAAAPPRTMPPALAHLLIDLDALAADHGQAIFEVACERGLGPFRRHERNWTKLAAMTRLDHPELFTAALRRTVGPRVTRDDFFARGPMSVDALRSTTVDAVFKAALERSRLRVQCSEVEVDDVGEEVELRVIHERHADSAGRHDVLRFHPTLRRLSVYGVRHWDAENYRAFLGSTFFGGRDFFHLGPAYTGRPLREDGPAALSTAGLPGLRRVVLREVVVEDPTPPHLAFLFTDRDLSSNLWTGSKRQILTAGVIGKFAFDFELLSSAQPLRVVVTLPNRIEFDAKLPPARVDAFLQLRGFLNV